MAIGGPSEPNLMVSEKSMANVTQLADMTTNDVYAKVKDSRSFISYTTSYRLSTSSVNSNFCSRTRRLATTWPLFRGRIRSYQLLNYYVIIRHWIDYTARLSCLNYWQISVHELTISTWQLVTQRACTLLHRPWNECHLFLCYVIRIPSSASFFNPLTPTVPGRVICLSRHL